MKKVWPWIVGGVVVLIILGWLFFGRSDRQAYWIARGNIEQRVEASQEQIDMAVEMATEAVDLALEKAGNLPSQEAKADLIKQDIEEIGNRLKEASEAAGDAAITKLNQSIEQFNTTLENVEDASSQVVNPEVKSTLDRIYGILESVKEQIQNFVVKNQE
jgi:molecular chaperone GrpE (heat shock protein)